jgi:hypothetical protein
MTDHTCRYTIDEMCNGSALLFCADSNCAECIEQTDPPDTSTCMMHRVFRNDGEVLAEMSVFHQFQDRIVVESAKGREMKALFHDHMFELGLVLFRNPDLLLRGRALLQIAAPGFRNLLDPSVGEPLVLTPELVETIDRFLADVAEHAGPDGQAALEQVRAEFAQVEGKSLHQIRAAHRSK